MKKVLTLSGQMFVQWSLLLIFFSAFGLIHVPVYAQLGNLVITENTTAQQAQDMIQNVFISGDIQISNVVYTGYPQASGSFIGNTGVGFLKGMILTSGRASIADGPNGSASAGFDNPAAGDTDLNQMAGGTSHDACVLAFDFVPKTTRVKFNYVFGSEEYPEYAPPNNSSYNDKFGFFLSGPGINGTYQNNAINIALLPNNTPVSINNVNAVTNQEFYVSNWSPVNNNNIQYDGYTVMLTAESVVTPCVPHRIKLAISDGGDGVYDSGVFLEANSFSDGSINCTVAFDNILIDTMAVEQCNNATVKFDIIQVREETFTMNLVIGGTAIEGEDYAPIPHQVEIPPGQRIFELTIVPYQDNVIEGMETVLIMFQPDPCNIFVFDTVKVKIYDKGLHSDTTKKVYSSCGEDVVLHFNDFLNGTPPYTHNWLLTDGTPLGTTPTLTYSPVQDSIAILNIITDACGQIAVDTAIVVIAPVAANAGIDQSLCNDPSVTIGTPAVDGYYYAWTSDPVDPSLAGQENIAQPVVAPAVTTRYMVEVTNDCDGLDNDETWVLLEGAVAYAGEDNDICVNESFSFSANDAETWQWTANPPDASLAGQETNQTITVSPATTTTYSLTVTNDCGFTADDEVILTVHPLPLASAGSNDEICLGDSYSLNASGGATYEWWSVPNDPSLFVGNQHLTSNPTVTPTGTQIEYFVKVTSIYGCENEAAMTLTLNPSPVIEAQVDDDVICMNASTTLRAIGSANFTWSANPPDPSLVGQENDPNPVVTPPVGTTTYTLLGEAPAYDCPTTTTIQVTVRPAITAAINATVDRVCQNANFSASYLGNAAMGTVFTWDFDGATVTYGSGPGLYNMNWSTPGVKTISVLANDAGCESPLATYQVTVVASPQASFSADLTEGCLPITVQFDDNSQNLSQPVVYEWNLGNGTTSSQPSPTVVYDQAGDYTVSLKVTNEGLCESVAPESGMVISSFANPVAGFDPDPQATTIREPIVGFVNSSSGEGLSYEWDFGDGTTSTEAQPVHIYTETGTYEVVLLTTTANGCVDSVMKTVDIFPDYAVFPANAFSPNGDGLNDVFEVKTIAVAKYNIKIYNRWGQVIFESDDVEKHWDGKVKGELVPAGSYIYHVTITNMVDETTEKRGTVNVLH
ncbi:MAG: choice-of-anchor L domain-containing protein [Bacteroidales bacterium]|nr:choice-of-anchor L domain-containing protein [Bacteroidales bacterium]